ncbi:MAG: hypothetical protein Kow00109_14590 [Acidobacteriota bacterium]
MQGTAERLADERLFAYGTLMFADVLRAVLGRVIPGDAAVLEGFVRRRVRGTIYPGIVPGSGTVKGVLYEGLQPADWILLDRFEGDEYQRERVAVLKAGAADPVACWTYVYRTEWAGRLEGEWAPEGLEPRILAEFTAARRRRR